MAFDVVLASTGTPATDLQPYLGALAHFVILSEDGEEYLHVHPDAGASTAGRTVIKAHTLFPKAGLYKAWAQFQRQGEVETLDFVLRVTEAATGGHEGGHTH